MEWYRGELLNMAVDVATRLLPAFNSTTGLPYPRVNLRTGLEGVNTIQLTCTACAGSMILEFAALSRLIICYYTVLVTIFSRLAVLRIRIRRIHMVCFGASRIWIH
jgi:hypothetical protein